ncbi:MAG: glycosyltransferase family 2 protein, partial [Mariprofundaceae bacterium]
MTKKVSVYIPVLNEESRIESALKSLDWVDEIVIIDTGCTDGTIPIAKQYTNHIVAHEFAGFGRLRNFGIDACSNEWIISIDADERCTPELAQEIRKVIQSPHALDAYWI